MYDRLNYIPFCPCMLKLQSGHDCSRFVTPVLDIPPTACTSVCPLSQLCGENDRFGVDKLLEFASFWRYTRNFNIVPLNG